MEWVQTLATEFAISVGDQSVWAGIGVAALLATFLWVIGSCIAALVRLNTSQVYMAEVIGVGLAIGSIVVTTWWATAASGGRSSFTPVGVAFLLVMILAIWERRRGTDEPGDLSRRTPWTSWSARRILVGATSVVVALFLVGMLYASTLTLSPRDGVQPLEFMDQAFYSILALDLSRTGVEDVFSPAGFDRIGGAPTQTWYHWGEIWLAAALISSIDVEPLAARHFVVLPILILASGLLGGTLVRQMTGTSSRVALLFGGAVCLLLAPIPLVPGPYFGSWAVGLVFGITQYGLAGVIVLLAGYCSVLLVRMSGGRARSAFVGTVYAALLPAHVVIFLLAAIGVACVLVLKLLTAARSGSVPRGPTALVRAAGWAFGVVLATGAWGLVTGHGFGGNGVSPTVAPFSAFWSDSLVVVAIGAGAFFAIPVAWVMGRRHDPLSSAAFVAVGFILVVGAVGWGARFGDFNMFHVFFGGLALIATPIAAVALWTLARRLRRGGRRLGGVLILTLCAIQMETAAAYTVLRLQRFGPGDYDPVPVAMLSAIRALPENAKLAYACRPLEEIAVWDARLLAIDAHTSRRVIPMCFQADFFAYLNGGQYNPEVMSPLFALAPQRQLYPNANANPSRARILQFMDQHGIDYIFADGAHPNTLVPDATTVFASGTHVLSQVP